MLLVRIIVREYIKGIQWHTRAYAHAHKQTRTHIFDTMVQKVST